MSIGYNGSEYFAAKGNVNTGEFQLGGKNASGYYTTIYSNNAETVRVAGGNVGINQNSPQYPLHVKSSAGASGTLSLSGGSESTGGASYIIMGNNDSAGVSGPNVIVSANRTLQFGHGTSFTAAAGGVFTSRLAITSNGGIAFGGVGNFGTSGYLLQSNGDAAPTWVALSSLAAASASQVNVIAQGANASYYPTFVDSNNAVSATELLYTTSSFSVNPVTGVQISSLGVGTPGSGTAGEIRATNEITAYYSSDARLKENVTVIDNAIEKVQQLRGVYFDWTDENIASRGGEDGFFVRKHDVGVIAQEVQQVLPELVAQRSDGYLAVKYEKLVSLLIEAVKDQQQQIAQLSETVKQLVNK
jgi:hypothetical protein